MRIPSIFALGALCLGACSTTPEPTLSFDGSPLACDASGEGATTLLFVHGWCCNRGQWRDQAAALATDFRVVNVDLPGHGESIGERSTWDVRDYARDVEALVHELGLERVVVVGHSMGGPIGLLAAARLPRQVIGVVGVDTLQSVTEEIPEEFLEGFFAMLDEDFAGAMSGFVHDAFAEEVDPAIPDRVAREAALADPEMAKALVASYAGVHHAAALAACPVPVVCVNGTAMGSTDVEGNRAFDADFEVLLMEGCGHWPMLEDPEGFERRLREAIARVEAHCPPAAP